MPVHNEAPLEHAAVESRLLKYDVNSENPLERENARGQYADHLGHIGLNYSMSADGHFDVIDDERYVGDSTDLEQIHRVRSYQTSLVINERTGKETEAITEHSLGQYLQFKRGGIDIDFKQMSERYFSWLVWQLGGAEDALESRRLGMQYDYNNPPYYPYEVEFYVPIDTASNDGDSEGDYGILLEHLPEVAKLIKANFADINEGGRDELPEGVDEEMQTEFLELVDRLMQTS